MSVVDIQTAIEMIAGLVLVGFVFAVKVLVRFARLVAEHRWEVRRLSLQIDVQQARIDDLKKRVELMQNGAPYR